MIVDACAENMNISNVYSLNECAAEMWQQICMTNSENIVELLDKYIDRLVVARERIKVLDEQFVFDMFTNSREYRNGFYRTVTII